MSQTHCVAPEQTFFSCSIADTEKIASLCGVVSTDPEESPFSHDSWLQYRFGRLGATEFRFPQSKQGSISKFQGEVLRSVVGTDYLLWFSNNGTTYHIEFASYGLSVWAGEKKLACSGNVINNGITDLADRLRP